MNYSFHPEALEEYLGTVEQYSNIRRHLGEAFVNEVEAAIERIAAHPAAWQHIEGWGRCQVIRHRTCERER